MNRWLNGLFIILKRIDCELLKSTKAIRHPCAQVQSTDIVHVSAESVCPVVNPRYSQTKAAGCATICANYTANEGDACH